MLSTPAGGHSKRILKVLPSVMRTWRGIKYSRSSCPSQEVIEVDNRARSGPVDVTVDILALEVESEVFAAEGLACTV